MALGPLSPDYDGSLTQGALRGQTTRNQALSRARALLGVSADASRAEILEAHKRLIAMVHPDRGGTTDQVYEANAARDLLLNTLLS